MSDLSTPVAAPQPHSQAAFADFRRTFPATPPKIVARHLDECVQMTPNHGLRWIDQPQAEAFLVASAPGNDEDAKLHRFLWVVGIVEVPYALEDCAFGHDLPGLKDGLIKHTNLTGAGNAHCAGEAWFIKSDAIIINGSSGRYGPRDENQLRAAGLALKACGYQVGMIRFDETGWPATIVVGEEDLQWL